jgi:hypothetical protein
VPSGRDLADDAAGGLLSSANRDTQPIGEAQPRHIDDLRRQGALSGGGDVGGDSRSICHDEHLLRALRLQAGERLAKRRFRL